MQLIRKRHQRIAALGKLCIDPFNDQASQLRLVRKNLIAIVLISRYTHQGCGQYGSNGHSTKHNQCEPFNQRRPELKPCHESVSLERIAQRHQSL